METKVIRVTPPMAREWLKKNVDNRPLSKGKVEGLRLALQRGEYMTTHQGVAFDTDGNLLDGQHRLHAIADMPETFGVEILVTRDLPRASFKAIDIGQKRTPSDVLRISQGLAAVARFLAGIVETQRTGITPQLLVPYVSGVAGSYARLIGYTPTTQKTWASSPVRAAAIVRMLSGGDSDYILLSYHALVHAEFDAMAPIIQTLYRQQAKGLVRSGGFDLFVRAYRAFDAKKQHLGKMQINDQAAMVQEVRDVILQRVLAEKKAALAGAAKKVSEGNSKVAARA